MLFGAHTGGLELRKGEGGATLLRATFPYGQVAVLSPGGRSGPARSEVFAPRAFADRITRGEDVHFLASHDYAKPLASRSAGTLRLTDTEAALIIEADISADMAAVSYVADFLASHAAGLVRGLSPGFRVADTAGAEVITGQDGALLRTIRSAQLFEVSAVTVPAYPAAQIEARNWTPGGEARDAGVFRSLNRWRL